MKLANRHGSFSGRMSYDGTELPLTFRGLERSSPLALTLRNELDDHLFYDDEAGNDLDLFLFSFSF